jgi:hypothetical protein
MLAGLHPRNASTLLFARGDPGAHLLGGETGAASGACWGACCHTTTNTGRRDAKAERAAAMRLMPLLRHETAHPDARLEMLVLDTAVITRPPEGS